MILCVLNTLKTKKKKIALLYCTITPWVKNIKQQRYIYYTDSQIDTF